MGKRFKDTDTKNRACYFFYDKINKKNLDPNKIKIDEKPYKNILIYYIEYVMVKNLRYVKISSTNPLYLIINEINGCTEESNGNKSFMPVPANENKEIMKKIYQELWSNIRDFIRSNTDNSNDYDEKYMKIKFNFDDNSPLNKTIELCNRIVVIRAAFHEENKYYSQVCITNNIKCYG